MAHICVWFLKSLIFTFFGYVTVKFSEAAKMDGVKYTAQGYIAPAVSQY